MLVICTSELRTGPQVMCDVGHSSLFRPFVVTLRLEIMAVVNLFAVVVFNVHAALLLANKDEYATVRQCNSMCQTPYKRSTNERTDGRTEGTSVRRLLDGV